MSNKLYDILKKLASPILPALATLLIALGKIWGIPVMTPIAATVSAIAAFIGAITVTSSAKYFKDKEIVPSTMGVYGDGSDEDE